MSDQVIRRETTTQVAQPVVGDNPQKVFQQKKMIFQFNNVVWYIIGLIEVLLLFRFFLKVISTESSGFASFIFNLSEIFVIPFKGIVASYSSGNSTFEWAAVISMIVLFVVGLIIVYFVNLVRPVSPQQVRDSEQS